jgi:hypothetical protein
MVQTGFGSLVPKRRLESTVNIVVERALEPGAYASLLFSHVHDRLQQGFASRPDNPIVKIIVKTWLKGRSECSACRQSGEHPCCPSTRNTSVNSAAICTIESMAPKNAGLHSQPYHRLQPTKQPIASRAATLGGHENGDDCRGRSEAEGAGSRR